MKPRPALRLRVLAGALFCATAILFSFTVFSTASAGATASPIDGVLNANVRFVQSLSGQINSLKIRLDGFASTFATKQLFFDRASGTTVTVQTLCIGSTCLTEAQLQEVLAIIGQASAAATSTTPTATSTSSTQNIFVSASDSASSTAITDDDLATSTASEAASSTSPFTSGDAATSTDENVVGKSDATNTADDSLFTSPEPDDAGDSVVTTSDSTTTP
jgi:hypothetical protein